MAKAAAARGAATTIVDFRRSLPTSPPILRRRFSEALQAISQSHDLARLAQESVPGGAIADRAAGSEWLGHVLGARIPAERIVVTSGAQGAILMLLRQLAGSGGLIAAERLTYGPLRRLADSVGARIVGLDLDEGGILPSAFAAACERHRIAALYCNPTVHNPTTAVMGRERRMEIAEIAQRFAVAIIEDDALRRLHAEAPAPIAAYAPDLTWYVMTTSKCLAHGLRLAYLVLPQTPKARATIEAAERLSYWHPSPVSAAIATHWIKSGAADEIVAAIKDECVRREQSAREALAGFDLRSQPGSMHLWLTLPGAIEAGAFAEIAAQAGVLMRPADMFAVEDGPAPNAVRLSLSTPPDLQAMQHGLSRIKALVASS